MQNALTDPNTPPAAEETHPLADLVAALTQAVRNSEDNFLDLGMNLQKIQMTSSSQQKKISATMGLFKGEEQNGILHKISAYVRESQARTSQAQQQAAELCHNLQSMIHLVDTFSRNCHSLERAGLLLHVIGTNTGIECARATTMEATFKVVSKDTLLLAEQIRAATESLFDQVARARNEQTATLQVANRDIEALRELSQSSNKATESAMAKVGELVDYSINMVAHANQLAGEITLGINRVVMGIQFHDNLRQRIEHVNQALLELPPNQDRLSLEECCQSFLTVELQKAQIDQLVDELDSLYHAQNQALAHIVKEIYRLQGRLGGMPSKNLHAGTSENPVAELLAGIDSLEKLNADSQTLGQGIAASAARANEVAREMQLAIQSTFSIATQVKINALNAIIKAAKFGHAGEALQVLAQGMVGVSRDVRQLVNVFNDLLDQLGQLTRNDFGDNRQAQDTEGIGTIDIQQVFDQFAAELQLSRRACDELAQNLERETHGLVFIGELKETLAVQAARLGEQLAGFEPPAPALLDSQRNQFGAQLYQRYTMDEERAVHRRILSAMPVVAPAAAVAADDCQFFDAAEPDEAPAETAADFGEMEFFDTPASSDEPELWGTDSAPAAAGAIELFDDPAPAGQGEPGDIELFDPPEAPQKNAAAEIPSSALETAKNAGSIELFDPPAPVESPVEIELWDDVTPPDNSGVRKPQTKDHDVSAAEEKEDFGDNIELF